MELRCGRPGIPTALVSALDHGCTGGNDDSTACAQATIDAAAKQGNGAAAYFPPGTYMLNKTLVVKGGNYSVMGGGFGTQFKWSAKAPKGSPPPHADRAPA